MRLVMSVFLLTLSLTACAVERASVVDVTTPTRADIHPSTVAPPVSPSPTYLSSPATGTPSVTIPPQVTAAISTTELTSPAATRLPLADLMATTAATLADRPPLRDDVRLAIAYGDYEPAMATPEPTIPPVLGAVEPFYIGNGDDLTVSQISAELRSIGERAYFWFDQGEASVDPDPALLDEMTTAFDSIFDELYAYFGDGPAANGHAHVVHASPLALCASAYSCQLAGYFSDRDMLPRAVYSRSNERSMFVMNARQFGTLNYLDVLAHELRHLLGADYDSGEEDWFVEGAAMLAEDLVGFSALPRYRGSLFLTNPDQQLNSWTDDNTIPYYGQGYLLNRFLYDRLGAELYRAFTRNPEVGLAAVDEVATVGGVDASGKGLWLDWLVAMALAGSPDVPERWRWEGPELTPAVSAPVDSLPANVDAAVSQYAADYYRLPSSGTVAIDFSGQISTPLLKASPPSGDAMWYAQRANGSNPRLTRAVDLRDVSEATLNYQVYADIEPGYDFAYVSASTDGGQTWQPLTGSGMQGADPADDPGGNAFTDRFYTGRNPQWVPETIDLTPFVGQEILLRFEYVTDLILTYGGFALDDISIPEIGFQDEAEMVDPGWQSEGFVRASAELPQEWHVQLVTFDQDEQPVVTTLPVAADGRGQWFVEGIAGRRRPLLIIAATAPETLETAAYRLHIAAP